MMKRFSFIFCAILTFFSCADQQNFDQFDDLSVEPEVATSIFYFESDEVTINAAGTGRFYNQTFTFEAFNEDFVSDRILNGVITYQIENTTSKALGLQIDFVDEDGNILDTENFNIENEPVPLFEMQVPYGDEGKSLDILRNTTNITVSGENLGDATSRSTQPNPRIIFRSSAAFRLRLR